MILREILVFVDYMTAHNLALFWFVQKGKQKWTQCTKVVQSLKIDYLAELKMKSTSDFTKKRKRSLAGQSYFLQWTSEMVFVFRHTSRNGFLNIVYVRSTQHEPGLVK